MKLLKPINALELKRLTYSKFLFNKGSSYLTGNTTESYFNIAIILLSNSLEIMLQVMTYCRSGEDMSDKPISEINKNNKKIVNYPFNKIEKVIKARNAIYHSASLHTYFTCLDIKEITERCLIQICKEYLNTDFQKISLVLLIHDKKIRETLKKSEESLNTGKYEKSIYECCEGFGYFELRLSKRSNYQINNLIYGINDHNVSWNKMVSKYLAEIKSPMLIESFSKHIDEMVNKKLETIAKKFDFMLQLGDLYEDYKHFLSITPLYHKLLIDEISIDKKNKRKIKFDKNNAEFIFNFCINSILKIESKLRPIEIKALSGEVIKTIE